MQKKKNIFIFLLLSVFILTAAVSASVTKLGYDNNVKITQGKSKTYGAYNVDGVNVQSGIKINSASYYDGYVQVEQSIKKCTAGGLICGSALGDTQNLTTEGYTYYMRFKQIDPGKYKFIDKVNKGTLYSADLVFEEY